MHMVFTARARPSAKASASGRSELNIYLILCRLLGVEPAPNDGDWRDVKQCSARNNSKFGFCIFAAVNNPILS